MAIFAVPDTLEAVYKGDGMALAASHEGQLLALKYLRDLLPDVESLECDERGQVEPGVLEHPRLAPTVRELGAIGRVHLGVCAGWEFVEVAGADGVPIFGAR